MPTKKKPAKKKPAKKKASKPAKKKASKPAKKKASKPAKKKATKPAKKKKASTKKTKSAGTPTTTAKKGRPRIPVTVTLWEPIMPIDRGDRYEDPLEDMLIARGWGEVVGGGSGLSSDGEIEYVDIELDLVDDATAIAAIRGLLEVRGAPKHSELRVTRGGRDTVVGFGLAEGIGIYLDGVGLPDDVYKTSSVDELVEKLMPALDNAEIRGSWQGPKETSLYLYAPSADALWKRIEPIMKAYPLCANARVVLRLGHATGKPVEVRLPAGA